MYLFKVVFKRNFSGIVYRGKSLKITIDHDVCTPPKAVAQRKKKTKVVFLICYAKERKKERKKKVDVNWKASHSDADGAS